MKAWHDFAANNADMVKPYHGSLLFYCLHLNNRLNWVDVFGLPSDVTMHYIGIANYKTYKNAFNDLVEFGFIEVVGKSTNNYTATKIRLLIEEIKPKKSKNKMPIF